MSTTTQIAAPLLANILIIDQDAEYRSLLNITIGTYYQCQFTHAASHADAIQKIETAPHFDLIVMGSVADSGDFSKLDKVTQKIHRPWGLLTIGESLPASRATQTCAVARKFIESNLVECIGQLFKAVGLPVTLEENFAPVPLSVLRKLGKLAAPLYLRLADNKMIKILNADTFFDAHEEKRFRQKDVTELFIEKKQYQHLLQNFKTQVLNELIFSANHLDPVEGFTLSVSSQELVQNAIKAFGIQEEVISITNRNIVLVRSLIENDDHLSHLAKIISSAEAEYRALHATLLSYITSALAQHHTFRTTRALEKMALAAFIHDITLEDHHVRNEKRYINGLAHKIGLNKKDLQLIQEHPTKAAELLKDWSDCPPEVFDLVQGHHERPDGSGFPNGLRAEEMSELLACFIVAHDIVDLYLESKDINRVQGDFQELRAQYKSPIFEQFALIASELLSD